MPKTLAISPHIVEGLYREALTLSEDVRTAFALSDQLEAPKRPAPRRVSAQTGRGTAAGAANRREQTRLAYSRTGLRTTTRMMHAIAWLLNHRAYFMGEINEMQLRRNGRLAVDLRTTPDCDEAQLSETVLELVERTQTFYERLLRLDENWSLSRDAYPSPTAIQRLRKRIEGRLAS